MRRRRISYLKHHAFEESLINLTPLIDVVFVILISFILIAPLLEIDHVGLSFSGPSSESTLNGKSPITIYVRDDNSVWINRRLVTIDELTRILGEKKKQFPSEIPQLFHDQKATFGTYQSVKNAAEVAGFSQLDVVLQASK
ncbi:MAG: biopolymer transporter ExbD [Chlamydiota bacterium]